MSLPSHAASWSAIAAAAVASAVAYPFLPDRVATHFDEDGRPDRYSPRTRAALSLPVLMSGLSIVNDRFGGWPGTNDRENAASGVRAREQAIGLVELSLLPAHLAILANGLGLPIDMARTPRIVYGTLMLGLGNVLPKLPRNGLIGIRTPWTMSDPSVWERTHRLAGYLITAAGVVSLASVPAKSKRAARVPMIAVIGAVIASVAYSFVVRSHKR